MLIDDLTLIKPLGKGAFGEVYLTSKQGTSIKYATKKIEKSRYLSNSKAKKYLDNEIAILKDINHPNIVKLIEIKENSKYCFIVTEFCNGGSLSNCLEKYQDENDKAFPEEIVQYLMRQIMDAMRYLHKNKILHRDLKLDNILVNYDNEIDKSKNNIMKGKIKIIDFGFARYLKTEKLAYSTLGSPINMDPGILQKLNKVANYKDYGYDEKADIWSLGTICYELLIGKTTFDSESMKELLNKVNKGKYYLPKTLSKETVSFLNGMLQYDPKKRLTADKLYHHKFLRMNIKDFKNINLKEIKKNVKGSKIQLNSKVNKSIWDIFGDGVMESISEEIDEEENNKQKELAEICNSLTSSTFFESSRTNNTSNQNKTPKRKVRDNLDEMFLKAFNEINIDSVIFEPKIVPFMLGLEANIDNINHI